MYIRFAPLLLLPAAACAAAPTTRPAVAPALPPASFHQVTVLDADRTVLEFEPNPNPGCCPAGHPTAPCVIDLQDALRATPEAEEFIARGYDRDSAEYHLLIARANERLRAAVRRIARRHGFDLVLERGAVVLRPEASDVAVADITAEVAHEVKR